MRPEWLAAQIVRFAIYAGFALAVATVLHRSPAAAPLGATFAVALFGIVTTSLVRAALRGTRRRLPHGISKGRSPPA